MDYHNILLIDDDEEDQEIFCNALEMVSDQLKCTCFTNAKLALDKLVAKQLIVDIIFLDLNMPIMTGSEFLMEIKNIEELRSIPVVIFSTSSNPATIENAKKLGAIDFITKPNGFDTLIKILSNFLNKAEIQVGKK